ncbi:olfactory receptor 14A16-like [Trichosurus vulpecula]|uniref:olfactory receptor 14A16-like n=1 Tax=Trichosurus vulpecula TaxID=9337 RepID=UPI00186AF571|nr:olfactory receptor 14A16-like [Trichosurus vulpecula]
MANLTVVTGFFLMGFSNTWELQVLHAILFLLIYLVALMGNILIFTLISLDGKLHTPMYFFLKNLSFLDLCFISITVPKSIANSLSHSYSISFWGCVSQLFLMMLSVASELFLLTVMFYDCYVAIFKPLHYDVIMTRGACVRMAAVSWLSGGLFGALHSASTFTLLFCGSKKTPQFFCDVPSLLRISCSNSYLAADVSLAIGVGIGVFCCVYIIISYTHVFSTVLKIPTTEGRSKAFSTCLPHLIIIVVFITTGLIAYLKPPQESDSVIDLLLSMFYTVVPPTINPVIYSLRNKDMKTALMKLIACKYFSKRLIPKSFP